MMDNRKKIDALKKYLLGKRILINGVYSNTPLIYVINSILVDERGGLYFYGPYYSFKGQRFDIYSTDYMYQYVERIKRDYFNLQCKTEYNFYYT